MRLYTARWLIPIRSTLLPHGSVVVDEGRIAGVGRTEELRARFPEAKAVDLGSVAVLPGLVNAHTHLELSWMADHRPAGGSYTDWIRGFLAIRADEEESRVRQSAAAAIESMVDRGTVAVGDVGNRLDHVAEVSASPLHGVLFHEIYGLQEDEAEGAIERSAAKVEQVSTEPAFRGGAGRLRLAPTPHAPHTTSTALLRALAGRATAADSPLSIHAAESDDESRLLENGDGPLAELFRELNFLPESWQPPGRSPVEHLHRIGLLSPRTLVVHGVHVDPRDRTHLQSSGATVVTCPRSNRYLGVGPAPVPQILRQGIPVALGTDSLASCPDLDLFAEMAALKELHPSLSPAAILRMATLNGAVALGLGDRLGSIEEGKLAELIVVELDAEEPAPLEALCSIPGRVRRLADVAAETE